MKSSLFVKNQNSFDDFAIMPVAGLLEHLQNLGTPAFIRAITSELIPSPDQINELPAVENITYIGYPESFIDKENPLPLVMSGITSPPIWNNYCGKKDFLINVNAHPGSSGSPVFIINNGSYSSSNGTVVGNRVLFIGVIYASKTPLNEYNQQGLGIVQRSDSLLKCIDKIELFQ